MTENIVDLLNEAQNISNGSDIPFEIDTLAIELESEKEASHILQIVTSLFCDTNFQEQNPKLYALVNLELETLRGLLKMRKSDEKAHDALLAAISENKSNASLYRAMAEIQKTSISISNKIHDTIDRLNKACENVLKEQSTMLLENVATQEDNSETHRGTKSFIQAMLSNK